MTDMSTWGPCIFCSLVHLAGLWSQYQPTTYNQYVEGYGMMTYRLEFESVIICYRRIRNYESSAIPRIYSQGWKIDKVVI